MKKKHAQKFCDLIGQAIAGNGRLSDGTTLLEKYPERYQNVFTDWIDLLIAEAKAKQLAKIGIDPDDATNPH